MQLQSILVQPRQQTFDADKDMYPSKTVFEDAKALANYLASKGWDKPFESFLEQITLFDDARLDKVTVITCMQEWSVILQKYSDSITADAHLQILLEGFRFMVPHVAEEHDLAIPVATSKRDVTLVFKKYFYRRYRYPESSGFISVWVTFIFFS